MKVEFISCGDELPLLCFVGTWDHPILPRAGEYIKNPLLCCNAEYKESLKGWILSDTCYVLSLRNSTSFGQKTMYDFFFGEKYDANFCIERIDWCTDNDGNLYPKIYFYFDH